MKILTTDKYHQVQGSGYYLQVTQPQILTFLTGSGFYTTVELPALYQYVPDYWETEVITTVYYVV